VFRDPYPDCEAGRSGRDLFHFVSPGVALQKSLVTINNWGTGGADMVGSTTAAAKGSLQPEKGSEGWARGLGVIIAMAVIVTVFWMARPITETYEVPRESNKSVAQIQQEIEALNQYQMADGLRAQISHMLQAQLARAKQREMNR